MLHYLHVLLVVTQQPDIDETLKAIFVEDFFFFGTKIERCYIWHNFFGRFKCIFGTAFKFYFSRPGSFLLRNYLSYSMQF